MSSRFALTAVLALSTPVAFAGKTERISVDSKERVTSSGLSDFSSISANGRYAAFDSRASSLVPNDTNDKFDVFLRDRVEGTTKRISVSSHGDQGDADSYAPSISGNGRYIAFESDASTLVDGDTNSESDIFVHDRVTGKTTRVSVSSAGAEADGGSRGAKISANGRYVAFVSSAENLVEGDTNHVRDIFVHDRRTKKTRRVSVDSNGVQANHESDDASISAKGRAIAFESRATNLVPDDTNADLDVFVHDMKTGETTRVSVHSNGTQATGASFGPSMSANGRIIAFASNAPDLLTDDDNGEQDVFVHDRKTGITTRESVNSAAVQGNDYSENGGLSKSGRYLSFGSYATNLVTLDTNGSEDIFVRDRKKGLTIRASVRSDGGQSANPDAYYPALSSNGRVVIFTSNASDLDGTDSNDTGDIFVREWK